MSNRIPDEAGWLLDEYDAERFWGNVRFHGGRRYQNDPLVDLGLVGGDCWLWGTGDDLTVYGRFLLYGRWQQAHRVSYKDFGHKLPDDLDIDHLCRTHRCVRPSHLEGVSDSINIQRGAHAIQNRSFCRNGHEFTPANIVLRKRGERTVKGCRTCLAASKRRTYLKRKSAGRS